MSSYLMVIGTYHISDDDVFKDVGIIVGATRGHCGSCKVKGGHTTPKNSIKNLGEETRAFMTAAAPLRF